MSIEHFASTPEQEQMKMLHRFYNDKKKQKKTLKTTASELSVFLLRKKTDDVLNGDQLEQ